jgi:hypothetical protein
MIDVNGTLSWKRTQERARLDFVYNNNSLNYDAMLDLCSWAASEDNVNNNTAATDALNYLLDSATTSNPDPQVSMPDEEQLLTNAVLNPGSDDVNFLAKYCFNNVYKQSGPQFNWVYADSGGYHFGASAGDQQTANYAQMAALVNQWFLGTVYPDDSIAKSKIPELPYSAPSGPLSLYGPTGEPMFTDVQQGALGDCWVLSAVAAVAYKYPNYIKGMIDQHGNGTYTFCLWGPASHAWSYVTVDNELPNGGSEYDHPTVGNFQVMWAALTEKAFCEWEDYNPSNGGYCYSWLGGDNPVYSDWFLSAMTGLPSQTHLYDTPGAPKWTDVWYDLTHGGPGVPHGQVVEMSTTGSPNPELDGDHGYAILNCGPSDASDQCPFLLYNPWGILPVGAVEHYCEANMTSISIMPAGAHSPGTKGIGEGDYLEIDSELMQVKSVSGDVVYVTRDCGNTQPAAHDRGASVYLSFDSTGAWTQLENGNDIATSGNGGWPLLGLFTEPGSEMNGQQSLGPGNFYRLSNTNSFYGAAPASGALTAGAAAADNAYGLSASPAAGPGGGSLLGMPLSQATTLDDLPGEPLQVAAAMPANRLAALDAVLAANTFAGRGQSTGPAGGSLSGDDADSLFPADDPAAWRVKLTDLRTGPRMASL